MRVSSQGEDIDNKDQETRGEHEVWRKCGRTVRRQLGGKAQEHRLESAWERCMSQQGTRDRTSGFQEQEEKIIFQDMKAKRVKYMEREPQDTSGQYRRLQ